MGSLEVVTQVVLWFAVAVGTFALGAAAADRHGWHPVLGGLAAVLVPGLALVALVALVVDRRRPGSDGLPPSVDEAVAASPVLAVLRAGPPRSVDELVRASGSSRGSVRAQLEELAKLGHVERDEDDRWRPASRPAVSG